MKRFFVILAGFLLLVPSFSVQAQRQTRGRGSIDAYATFSGLTGGRFGPSGGGANWKMHQYLTHFSIGADVSALPVGVDIHTDPVYEKTTGEVVIPGSDTHAEHLAYDVCAGAGYYIRVLAPRSRVVILSAGANLYMGARCCPGLSSYSRSDLGASTSGDSPAATVGFVTSIVPEILLEVFPARNFSLSVSFRPRMCVVNTLQGSAPWLKCYAGFGGKYYL